MINLKKNIWKRAALDDVLLSLKNGRNVNQFDDEGEYRVSRIQTIADGSFDLAKTKWTNDKVNNEDYLNEGDILVSHINSVEHIGKSAIVPKLENKVIHGINLLRLVSDNKKIDNTFLFYFIKSDEFINQVLKYTKKAVNQASVKSTDIKQFQIPLPPLEEQKQIAALFQTIETALEQVAGQEKNLKALWKRLIDEFVSDKPSFGNLLKGKKLKTYNYCDVTEKLMRKIDPLTYDIERIVAGENLESEDFKIRTWQKVGEGYLGPAFHVLFKAGDILYGSRRTYLRKVSLADFDGVCSNTTYVLRSDNKILLQALLKHIMLTERFTQYSIGVSKGSTNPYINWKDLDNFSFQIPDLETQKEIANVLDGILEIVEQLKQQKTTLKNLKQKLLNEILG
jgi:type I restriction enzyme S subunit